MKKIKVVLGEWNNHASYTYTPMPKTAEEMRDNRMLIALFGMLGRQVAKTLEKEAKNK